MTVETASFLSQLDATYPASGDLKSEGDNHLRLIKSAVKATFPNLTAEAVTPSTTELNYVTGVTSAIQTQLNTEITARTDADTTEATARALADTTETNARIAADALKANLASPTFTGVVTVPTPSNTTDATNKSYVDTLVTATAFSTALPSQTGNAGKFVTTNGASASWGSAATLASNTFTGAQTLPAAGAILTGATSGTTTLVASASASGTAVLPAAGGNIGYLEIPQNSQSAAYTAVLADSGKHLLHPSADTTARTFTIPANSSVAYPIGTAITFVNQNAAGAITISITTDTMRLAGAGTTGSRTLAANGVATAIKLTSTEWIINGAGLT